MDPAPTSDILAHLVENHRQFRSFLQRRVSNPDDAEEILQTAFVKTVEKGDTIRDGESAVAWFYRLLRNAWLYGPAKGWAVSHRMVYARGCGSKSARGMAATPV